MATDPRKALLWLNSGVHAAVSQGGGLRGVVLILRFCTGFFIHEALGGRADEGAFDVFGSRCRFWSQSDVFGHLAVIPFVVMRQQANRDSRCAGGVAKVGLIVA